LTPEAPNPKKVSIMAASTTRGFLRVFSPAIAPVEYPAFFWCFFSQDSKEYQS
jgi:hypothetical protein